MIRRAEAARSSTSLSTLLARAQRPLCRPKARAKILNFETVKPSLLHVSLGSLGAVSHSSRDVRSTSIGGRNAAVR
jgi:hypothetical protein